MRELISVKIRFFDALQRHRFATSGRPLVGWGEDILHQPDRLHPNTDRYPPIRKAGTRVFQVSAAAAKHLPLYPSAFAVFMSGIGS